MSFFVNCSQGQENARKFFSCPAGRIVNATIKAVIETRGGL
jgi:hypothetical protein